MFRPIYLIVFSIGLLLGKTVWAKDNQGSITVVSKHNLCQLYFPSNWKAIYEGLDPSCEMYMTNGSAYLRLEICVKASLDPTLTIEELLPNLLNKIVNNAKTEGYVDHKKKEWKKVKLSESNSELCGYHTAYQIYLVENTAYLQEKVLLLNKCLFVVEGKENFYVFTVGIAIEKENKKGPQATHFKKAVEVLETFTILRDPVTPNFVDAVISNTWQQYGIDKSLSGEPVAEAILGANKGKKASTLLYQGESDLLHNTPFANYHVVYNAITNRIYLNTQRVNLADGSAIQQALFAIVSRKESLDDKDNILQVNEWVERLIAYDRGNRAAKNWRRFSDPKQAPLGIKVDDVEKWNEKNKVSLSTNNAIVANFRPILVPAWEGPIPFELDANIFASQRVDIIK